jgi:hypothetical protein
MQVIWLQPSVFSMNMRQAGQRFQSLKFLWKLASQAPPCLTSMHSPQNSVLQLLQAKDYRVSMTPLQCSLGQRRKLGLLIVCFQSRNRL